MGKDNPECLRWKFVCGTDGLLTRAVKARVELEEERLSRLPSCLKLQKMGPEFDLEDEKECFSCFYDLHLSAVSCNCSPNRYACLKHANFPCLCGGDEKFVLLRHTMTELKMFVDALEGHVIAVEKGCTENDNLVPDAQTDCSEAKQDHSGHVQKTNCPQLKVVSFCSPKAESLDLHKPLSPFGCLPHKAEHLDFHEASYDKELPILEPEDSKCIVDLNLDVQLDNEENMNLNITDGHDSQVFICLTDGDTSVCFPERENVLEGSNTSQDMPLTSCHDLYVAHEFQEKDGSSDPQGPGKIGGCKLFGVQILSADRPPMVPQRGSVTSTVDASQMEINKFIPHVEPIDYGCVTAGKFWCSNEAIFPKGYKSRVNFFSMLNPAKISSYVSEVVDAGLLGPIFKVTLEECPTISFADTTADKCWELVLDQVKQEIIKQSNQGVCGLPLLSHLQSINGLQMFGLMTPDIIQVIESLDPEHLCVDYWDSKLPEPSA